MKEKKNIVITGTMVLKVVFAIGILFSGGMIIADLFGIIDREPALMTIQYAGLAASSLMLFIICKKKKEGE